MTVEPFSLRKDRAVVVDREHARRIRWQAAAEEVIGGHSLPRRHVVFNPLTDNTAGKRDLLGDCWIKRYARFRKLPRIFRKRRFTSAFGRSGIIGRTADQFLRDRRFRCCRFRLAGPRVAPDGQVAV